MALVALVTGTSTGIGEATALHLARNGYRVFASMRNTGAGGQMAKTAVSENLALTLLQQDVCDPESNRKAVSDVLAEAGKIDVLVNNAGIAGPTGNLEDLSPDDWRRCIDICLTGQFLSARRAIPMIKAGGGGAIVNMASAAAKHGYAYRTPYSAAKFGVIGLTQSLAKELGPENIRVNAVLPGIVEGPRMEGVIRNRAAATGVSSEEMRAEYIKNISLRRMVSPEDVASTVAYLISDLGRNVSGQSISVDGNVETL